MNIYDMNYTESILIIQTKLEEFRKIVDLMSNSDIQDYSVIVLQGSFVCESMLELILKHDGYKVLNGMVEVEGKRMKTTLLSFCSHHNGILPNECVMFVNLIRNYRNQAAHVSGITYEMAVEFSKALDYFTLWVKKQYININILDDLSRAKIKDRFFSLEEKLTKTLQIDYRMESKDSISFVSESKTEYGLNYERVLLRKIAEQTDLIVNLSKQVNRIDERSERIEKTVSEIEIQIKELSGQILAYQSLVERQIEKAVSEEEIDRIIQSYADECVDRIVKQTKATTEDRIFEQEKRKLIVLLGQNGWDKLSEPSKTFLISAKVMYNHLIMIDDVIDYSGVCVLVTKALEVEMSKRFYSNFLNYLDIVYKKDYSKYHTALLFQGSKPLKPEKFTMGSIAFVLCYLENKHGRDLQKENNRKCLIQYAKDKVFSKYSELEIKKMIFEYAGKIEDVRNRYRNPSAHTNELKQVDAEGCFNLVLDVEKLLKRMLDSFDK